MVQIEELLIGNVIPSKVLTVPLLSLTLGSCSTAKKGGDPMSSDMCRVSMDVGVINELGTNLLRK
jgi:hypothetical protein